VKFQPDFKFLINYIWLAAEVIVISVLLEYMDINIWISILCWLIFIVIYSLFSFSGQSRFQFGFIVANVLLTQVFAVDIVYSSITMFTMLVFGWFNLKNTEYLVSEKSIVYKSVLNRSEYRFDAISELKLIQNPLGRSLNFGVIKVIFNEGDRVFYLDGILDHKKCLAELQSKISEVE
jgi:hypothetical protein